MSLSLDTVRAVARLLHETDLSEIEIDTGSDGESPSDTNRSGERVRLQLRRGYSPVLPTRAVVTAPAPVESRVETAAQPIVATAVGVFFAACEVGAQVKKNQVLGRVEALKIPHEVRADSAGEVVALLVEDGQGVEYGQDLMLFQAGEII